MWRVLGLLAAVISAASAPAPSSGRTVGDNEVRRSTSSVKSLLATPSPLDFGHQELCVSGVRTLRLQYQKQNDKAGSSRMLILNATASNPSFVVLNFEDVEDSLEPGDELSMQIAIIARTVGDLNGLLFIKTSQGTLQHPLLAKVSDNRYGVRPLDGGIVPAGTTWSPSITLSNPSGTENLVVEEMMSSEAFIHIGVSTASWVIAPRRTSSIGRIAVGPFHEQGVQSGSVQLYLSDGNVVVVPVTLTVVKPQRPVFDFGVVSDLTRLTGSGRPDVRRGQRRGIDATAYQYPSRVGLGAPLAAAGVARRKDMDSAFEVGRVTTNLLSQWFSVPFPLFHWDLCGTSTTSWPTDEYVSLLQHIPTAITRKTENAARQAKVPVQSASSASSITVPYYAPDAVAPFYLPVGSDAAGTDHASRWSVRMSPDAARGTAAEARVELPVAKNRRGVVRTGWSLSAPSLNGSLFMPFYDALSNIEYDEERGTNWAKGRLVFSPHPQVMSLTENRAEQSALDALSFLASSEPGSCEAIQWSVLASPSEGVDKGTKKTVSASTEHSLPHDIHADGRICAGGLGYRMQDATIEIGTPAGQDDAFRCLAPSMPDSASIQSFVGLLNGVAPDRGMFPLEMERTIRRMLLDMNETMQFATDWLKSNTATEILSPVSRLGKKAIDDVYSAKERGDAELISQLISVCQFFRYKQGSRAELCCLTGGRPVLVSRQSMTLTNSLPVPITIYSALSPGMGSVHRDFEYDYTVTEKMARAHAAVHIDGEGLDGWAGNVRRAVYSMPFVEGLGSVATEGIVVPAMSHTNVGLRFAVPLHSLLLARLPLTYAWKETTLRLSSLRVAKETFVGTNTHEAPSRNEILLLVQLLWLDFTLTAAASIMRVDLSAMASSNEQFASSRFDWTGVEVNDDGTLDKIGNEIGANGLRMNEMQLRHRFAGTPASSMLDFLASVIHLNTSHGLAPIPVHAVLSSEFALVVSHTLGVPRGEHPGFHLSSGSMASSTFVDSHGLMWTETDWEDSTETDCEDSTVSFPVSDMAFTHESNAHVRPHLWWHAYVSPMDSNRLKRLLAGSTADLQTSRRKQVQLPHVTYSRGLRPRYVIHVQLVNAEPHAVYVAGYTQPLMTSRQLSGPIPVISLRIHQPSPSKDPDVPLHESFRQMLLHADINLEQDGAASSDRILGDKGMRLAVLSDLTAFANETESPEASMIIPAGGMLSLAIIVEDGVMLQESGEFKLLIWLSRHREALFNSEVTSGLTPFVLELIPAPTDLTGGKSKQGRLSVTGQPSVASVNPWQEKLVESYQSHRLGEHLEAASAANAVGASYMVPATTLANPFLGDYLKWFSYDRWKDLCTHWAERFAKITKPHSGLEGYALDLSTAIKISFTSLIQVDGGHREDFSTEIIRHEMIDYVDQFPLQVWWTYGMPMLVGTLFPSLEEFAASRHVDILTPVSPFIRFRIQSSGWDESAAASPSVCMRSHPFVDGEYLGMTPPANAPFPGLLPVGFDAPASSALAPYRLLDAVLSANVTAEVAARGKFKESLLPVNASRASKWDIWQYTALLNAVRSLPSTSAGAVDDSRRQGAPRDLVFSSYLKHAAVEHVDASMSHAPPEKPSLRSVQESLLPHIIAHMPNAAVGVTVRRALLLQNTFEHRLNITGIEVLHTSLKADAWQYVPDLGDDSDGVRKLRSTRCPPNPFTVNTRGFFKTVKPNSTATVASIVFDSGLLCRSMFYPWEVDSLPDAMLFPSRASLCLLRAGGIPRAAIEGMIMGMSDGAGNDTLLGTLAMEERLWAWINAAGLNLFAATFRVHAEGLPFLTVTATVQVNKHSIMFASPPPAAMSGYSQAALASAMLSAAAPMGGNGTLSGERRVLDKSLLFTTMNVSSTNDGLWEYTNQRLLTPVLVLPQPLAATEYCVDTRKPFAAFIPASGRFPVSVPGPVREMSGTGMPCTGGPANRSMSITGSTSPGLLFIPIHNPTSEPMAFTLVMEPGTAGLPPIQAELATAAAAEALLARHEQSRREALAGGKLAGAGREGKAPDAGSWQLPPIPATPVVSAMVAHINPWLLRAIEEARSAEERTNGGIFRLKYCTHGNTASDSLHSLTQCSASVPWHVQLIHPLLGVDNGWTDPAQPQAQDGTGAGSGVKQGGSGPWGDMNAAYMARSRATNGTVTGVGRPGAGGRKDRYTGAGIGAAGMEAFMVPQDGPVATSAPAAHGAFALLAAILAPPVALQKDTNTNSTSGAQTLHRVTSAAYSAAARELARGCDAWSYLRLKGVIGSATTGFMSAASLVCELVEQHGLLGRAAEDEKRSGGKDGDGLSEAPVPIGAGAAGSSDASGVVAEGVESAGKRDLSSANKVVLSDPGAVSAGRPLPATTSVVVDMDSPSSSNWGGNGMAKESEADAGSEEDWMPTRSVSGSKNKAAHARSKQGTPTLSFFTPEYLDRLSPSAALSLLDRCGLGSLVHWHVPVTAREAQMFVPNQPVGASGGSSSGAGANGPGTSYVRSAHAPMRGYVDLYTGLVQPGQQMVIGPITYSPSEQTSAHERNGSTEDDGTSLPHHLLLWLLNNVTGVEPVWLTGSTDRTMVRAWSTPVGGSAGASKGTAVDDGAAFAPRVGSSHSTVQSMASVSLRVGPGSDVLVQARNSVSNASAMGWPYSLPEGNVDGPTRQAVYTDGPVTFFLGQGSVGSGVSRGLASPDYPGAVWRALEWADEAVHRLRKGARCAFSPWSSTILELEQRCSPTSLQLELAKDAISVEVASGVLSYPPAMAWRTRAYQHATEEFRRLLADTADYAGVRDSLYGDREWSEKLSALKTIATAPAFRLQDGLWSTTVQPMGATREGSGEEAAGLAQAGDEVPGSSEPCFTPSWPADTVVTTALWAVGASGPCPGLGSICDLVDIRSTAAVLPGGRRQNAAACGGISRRPAPGIAYSLHLHPRLALLAAVCAQRSSVVGKLDKEVRSNTSRLWAGFLRLSPEDAAIARVTLPPSALAALPSDTVTVHSPKGKMAFRMEVQISLLEDVLPWMVWMAGIEQEQSRAGADGAEQSNGTRISRAGGYAAMCNALEAEHPEVQWGSRNVATAYYSRLPGVGGMTLGAVLAFLFAAGLRFISSKLDARLTAAQATAAPHVGGGGRGTAGSKPLLNKTPGSKNSVAPVVVPSTAGRRRGGRPVGGRPSALAGRESAPAYDEDALVQVSQDMGWLGHVLLATADVGAGTTLQVDWWVRTLRIEFLAGAGIALVNIALVVLGLLQDSSGSRDGSGAGIGPTPTVLRLAGAVRMLLPIADFASFTLQLLFRMQAGCALLEDGPRLLLHAGVHVVAKRKEWAAVAAAAAAKAACSVPAAEAAVSTSAAPVTGLPQASALQVPTARAKESKSIVKAKIAADPSPAGQRVEPPLSPATASAQEGNGEAEKWRSARPTGRDKRVEFMGVPLAVRNSMPVPVPVTATAVLQATHPVDKRAEALAPAPAPEPVLASPDIGPNPLEVSVQPAAIVQGATMLAHIKQVTRDIEKEERLPIPSQDGITVSAHVSVIETTRAVPARVLSPVPSTPYASTSQPAPPVGLVVLSPAQAVAMQAAHPGLTREDLAHKLASVGLQLPREGSNENETLKDNVDQNDMEEVVVLKAKAKSATKDQEKGKGGVKAGPRSGKMMNGQAKSSAGPNGPARAGRSTSSKMARPPHGVLNHEADVDALVVEQRSGRRSTSGAAGRGGDAASDTIPSPMPMALPVDLGLSRSLPARSGVSANGGADGGRFTPVQLLHPSHDSPALGPSQSSMSVMSPTSLADTGAGGGGSFFPAAPVASGSGGGGVVSMSSMSAAAPSFETHANAHVHAYGNNPGQGFGMSMGGMSYGGMGPMGMGSRGGGGGMLLGGMGMSMPMGLAGPMPGGEYQQVSGGGLAGYGPGAFDPMNLNSRVHVTQGGTGMYAMPLGMSGGGMSGGEVRGGVGDSLPPGFAEVEFAVLPDGTLVPMQLPGARMAPLGSLHGRSTGSGAGGSGQGEGPYSMQTFSHYGSAQQGGAAQRMHMHLPFSSIEGSAPTMVPGDTASLGAEQASLSVEGVTIVRAGTTSGTELDRMLAALGRDFQ